MLVICDKGFLDMEYMDEDALMESLLVAQHETVEPTDSLAQTMANIKLLLDQVNPPLDDEKALEEQTRQLGRSHPTTIETLSRIAGQRFIELRAASRKGEEDEMEMKRRFDEAESLFGEIIDLRQSIADVEKETHLNELKALGSIYRNSGQWAKGIPIYDYLATIQKKMYGERCIQVVETLWHLGTCLGVDGQLDRATQVADEGFRIVEVFKDNKDSKYSTSLLGMKILYSMIHPPEGEPIGSTEKAFTIIANSPQVW
jgi:tetratricopeptide (TPR) repeat protein